MRFIITLVVFVIWAVVAKNYAAPMKPSIAEYTFGDGFFHGLSWFVLLIQKWFGAAIYVFADFHTWGYLVGFIIGCVFGTAILLGLLIGFAFGD